LKTIVNKILINNGSQIEPCPISANNINNSPS
jgi:hypothetical protein